MRRIMTGICKVHALKVAVGMILIILLAESAGAATEISACTTISSPGEYVLTKSIINSSADPCIAITSSDVTFDGAGYTIDGIDVQSAGVYVYNSTTTLSNVNVKNLILTDWLRGINYLYARNGSITNITAKANSDTGIRLYYSNYNTLTSNTANSSFYGIRLDSSNTNTLTNNTAKLNYYGIDLTSSSNNNLIGNTANSNIAYYGITLSLANNNTLTSNTANSNSFGIRLDSSNDNTITSNTANSNIQNGIYIYSSSSNTITNNNFNNTNNLDFSGTNNNRWNITKIPGTNIIGGPFIGGNFWAHPNGTGLSQTCVDADRDGICDTPYSLESYNIDYLPLAYSIILTPTLVDSYLPPGATPQVWKAGVIRAMDDYFAEPSMLTKSQLLSVMDAYFS